VPIITSGSGGRVVLLTFLSGAVLAGFGLKSFLRDQKRFRTIIFGLIFGLIVALIRPHFFFPLAILGLLMFSLVFYTLFFKKEIASLVFTLVVLVLTFVDLFRFGYRFLTFSNLKFLYPETEVVQYLKKGSKDNLTRNFGLVDPELATSLGLYTLETYNPLYLARNAYLFQALQGKLPSEPLPVNKYFFDVKKGRTKAVLDWLGVGYVVTGRDTNPASEYFTDEAEKELKLVFRDDKYAVYQNKTVLPRFGLYYKYQTVTDDQEILELLSSNLSDFKDKLILEESLPIELKIGQGEARLIYADVNSLKFMVNTNQPALFYLSDAFFPGWQVEVNQKLLPVHRANYNFRAVLVPVGESVVEFFYRPRYFFFSLMISLFSIISLWILSIKLRK
jgi:hypothetical protein